MCIRGRGLPQDTMLLYTLPRTELGPTLSLGGLAHFEAT